tara:strand:+ start:1043 stop:1270 length:228 start_codon:yes stop_codon:yes gene_type:complete
MSKMIEVRLQEIKDQMLDLEQVIEACEYALHYIAEVAQALPSGICMSHHAEMEMEDVMSEATDRYNEMRDKIGEI